MLCLICIKFIHVNYHCYLIIMIYTNENDLLAMKLFDPIFFLQLSSRRICTDSLVVLTKFVISEFSKHNFSRRQTVFPVELFPRLTWIFQTPEYDYLGVGSNEISGKNFAHCQSSCIKKYTQLRKLKIVSKMKIS